MAFLAHCIATEFEASQAPGVLPCFYMYESRALKASTARILFHHLRTPHVDIRSNFITCESRWCHHQFTYSLAQKPSREKTTTIHPTMAKKK